MDETHVLLDLLYKDVQLLDACRVQIGAWTAWLGRQLPELQV